MNRRNFLRGLLAIPAATTLNRVYSFPTDIVVVNNRAILQMFSSASEWKSTSDLIRPLNTYYDYCSESDLTLITAIDPVASIYAAQMTRRLASQQFSSHPTSISGIVT